MDPERMRRRLAQRESVGAGGGKTVAHCAKAFLNLQREGSGPGAGAAHNALLKELALFELDMDKAARLAEAAGEEVAHYESLEEGIAQGTAAAQGDILQLQARLKEERRIRQQKEECEALALQVNTEPERSATENEIQNVRRQLADLEAQQKEVRDAFELRRKQFGLLMHSIAELSKAIVVSSK